MSYIRLYRDFWVLELSWVPIHSMIRFKRNIFNKSQQVMFAAKGCPYWMARSINNINNYIYIYINLRYQIYQWSRPRYYPLAIWQWKLTIQQVNNRTVFCHRKRSPEDSRNSKPNGNHELNAKLSWHGIGWLRVPKNMFLMLIFQ